MNIIVEKNLKEFIEDHADVLADDSFFSVLNSGDLHTIENTVAEEFPNGVSAEELLSFLTEEQDFLARALGYDDFDHFFDETSLTVKRESKRRFVKRSRFSESRKRRGLKLKEARVTNLAPNQTVTQEGNEHTFHSYGTPVVKDVNGEYTFYTRNGSPVATYSATTKKYTCEFLGIANSKKDLDLIIAASDKEEL